MATETVEETYILSEDQLLGKAPLSAAMHPGDEVITNAESMETEEGDSEDLDLHVCGKCKAEFTNIQLYVEHKRSTCTKRTTNRSQDSPSKGKRGSGTVPENVTAILDPQVQGFCETVIAEGGIVVEAQEETQQEIIKAARASENQSSPEKKEGQLEPGEVQRSDIAGTAAETGSTFNCNMCEKCFDRPETLVVHQFMHKKFHQCVDCKRSFVSVENLAKHKKEFKHVFKCKICQAEFASQGNCKAHAATHTRQHECVDCKKKFFTEKSLSRHREKVLHNLPCDKCDKICRDKHALTKHQESHLKVKSHMCDWVTCERGFRSASELAKHKKCVHLGIKEHKCAECGREFARKDKLNRHLLIHSPNRPTYPCPFKTFTGCAKTFYRKDKLQRHIFAHSKEKPYKCETCNKVFARKDNLTEHIRIHTGEFKHRCPVCNKGMGGPKKLLLHVQQKHSGANEVIPEKPTMVSESVLLATSQAATVTTSTMTSQNESADATAASWVQENITGNKTQVQAVATSPASVSGMSEEFPAQQQEEVSEDQAMKDEGLREAENGDSFQQETQDEDSDEVHVHTAMVHVPQESLHVALQPHAIEEQDEVMEQQDHVTEQGHHVIDQQHHVPEQQQHAMEQQLIQQQAMEQQLSTGVPQQQQLSTDQPQIIIVPPPQDSPGSAPRVSVHYLASNTTSQAQYVPTLQQNVPSVTQSDTALLHEVLNELATRSLFNS